MPKPSRSPIAELLQELSSAIIGQREFLIKLIIGLLSGGHILIEGVPGLAKTTAAKSLAAAIDLPFRRIQFTPDLLPADLIGTMIYNPSQGSFYPRKGPIFTNILLADEINRAPAKVQSALLEAMQENQVTIGDATYRLDEPFMVLATQNPIEHEGTYPLPEAQVDRFMLKLKVGYPSREEELEIMRMVSSHAMPEVRPVIHACDVFEMRSAVIKTYLDEKLENYIVDIVRATREPKEFGLDRLEGLIDYGASPRASISMAITGKAHAFINGRDYVLPEDIQTMAPDILRHRIILSYEAEAEEIDTDQIISEILSTVEAP